MNRREWMKSAAVTAAVSAVPVDALASPQASGPAQLQMDIVRLNLRHTWTTTMSSSVFRETLYVRYTRDGVTGLGEGAPIVRYKESAVEGRAALEPLRGFIEAADPWHFDKLMTEVFARVKGNYAAKAALNIALMDWITRKLGLPVHRYFGIDPNDAPVTTFSIGMDKPDVVRQKVREAEPFPVLKVKVGLDSDEDMIAAVRSATSKPLRVDANEGWNDREVAVRKIEWLEKQNVELIEQPLPAGRRDDIAWIRERVAMPIFADESALSVAAVPDLVGAYDGINVKVDKCGGLLEAHRMINLARSLGLKTMLGCMVSSSVAITAAAHLSPLVDYADLDGHLLIANDPYRGVRVERGRLILPTSPGLGLKQA